jgi:hypothetical protein
MVTGSRELRDTSPGCYNSVVLSRRYVSLLVMSLTTVFCIAGQSLDEIQLTRFQAKVRQSLIHTDNFTCLETIARARRSGRPADDFRPLDTVRLEVSAVGGKELFAKPGGHFDDKEAGALVTDGIIGSGMFSGLARNLFLDGKGSFRYVRKENLAGHHSVRYDFQIAKQESSFELQLFNASEIVAAKGSFWFDSESLDLLRLEISGKDLPYDLHLAAAVVSIDYGPVRIGDSDALLAKRSELTLNFLSGDADRDVIEFSHCREYRAESTVVFGNGNEAPKP